MTYFVYTSQFFIVMFFIYFTKSVSCFVLFSIKKQPFCDELVHQWVVLFLLKLLQEKKKDYHGILTKVRQMSYKLKLFVLNLATLFSKKTKQIVLILLLNVF